MALVGNVVVGHGSIQEAVYVSIRSSPTLRAKNTVPQSSTGAKEIESQKSRPVTRLQKASNLSSPGEGKNIELASHKPDRSPSKLKNTIEYQSQRQDYIGGSKRKSTEVTEELDKFENSGCSISTLDNSNVVLKEVENENDILSRRSPRTGKPILNLPIIREKENESKAEVHSSQNEENDGIEWKNRLRSQKNNGGMGFSGLTLKSLKETKEQSLTSNQNFNFANKCIYSASTKKGKTERNKSKRPKREFFNKIGESYETTIPVSEDHIIDNGEDEKRESTETLRNIDKESDRPGRNESNDKLRCNRAISCEVRDTDEDLQYSKDSPRLKTPTKKVSNNNFAMCPGALIQGESLTLRSTRRRQSAVGDCKLSPISPCNLDGQYSVLSSCSEDIEFLPSGFRVYSSFGSSLGDVYKDVNHIVDQIGDGDHENENVFDPKSDASTGSSEIACRLGGSYTVQSGTKDRVNGAEMQVSLTFMNVRAFSAGCGGKEEGSSATSATAKRKRMLNEEEESSSGRKCKRLSIASNGGQVTPVENGITSEIGENDSFRSSVAERVKLNRAISESLQQCVLLGVSDGDSAMRLTGEKRMNVLQSSPFVEITNTGKKRKERAKSEGRIRTSARSIVNRNKNGRSQPLSACLTPNDPFSFDDY